MMAPHPFRNHRFIHSFSGLALAVIVAPCLFAQSSSNTCATANAFPVNTSCVPVVFNKPNTYTATYNPGGCNSGNYDDAWGKFVATSTLTTVQYTPTAGDAILQVLAACGGALLGCSDVAAGGGTETVTIATVPGTTYYIRVQRYNSNTAMNGTLCVYSTSCLYRLNLNDSYGDGWGDLGGQAYAEIFVNGVSLGLWTLNSGYSGYVDFGVNNGDVVDVIFNTTGAGWYIDENSMELTVAGTCIYSTYNPPNVAVPYTSVVNCTPSPAALPQDCVGGATVCSNANINDNNATTGCVMDLNASNMGCLLNGERQGSWYYFSPSASGTLGFTLVPNGPTDDYDFALWGPYGAVQCPNTPPVRCSYFDGRTYSSTTTGMGNGASDVSEGAFQPPATNNGWVSTLNVSAGMVYVLYIDNWSSTGQAFNLSWQLSGGASLDCTTLPVELLSLNAMARDPVIDVAWATASERNSAYFEVQHSTDAQHFTTIGTLNAAGNSQFQTDYAFTDERPAPGANYYRLNQVDIDGANELSQTVVAFLGGTRKPVLFPNPANDQLNVAFHCPTDGEATLLVLDATGRTVAQSSTQVQRGEQAITLPMADLAKGWYNLRILLPDGSTLLGNGFLKR